MNHQACHRAGLTRSHDLYVAAQIVEGQAQLPGVIAYTTLHGWELAGDKQHLHGCRNPAGVAGVRRPERSTWP